MQLPMLTAICAATGFCALKINVALGVNVTNSDFNPAINLTES